MAVPRSKTAPHSLDKALYTQRPGITRAKSTLDDLPQLRLKGLVRLGYGSNVPGTAVSPLSTPRDREDPFNLAGFFPASYSASPTTEKERWEWLRQEEDEYGAKRDAVSSVYSFSEEGDGSLPTTPGPAGFARMEEDKAEEAIKGEDKMGILSLDTYFATKEKNGVYREDRLYSPYSDEEAVDHESLYLALSARRQTENEKSDTMLATSAVGELFLSTSGEEEDREGSTSWTRAVRRSVQVLTRGIL
ncbi:hypothetical protein SERLA73DRAFT_174215 [Serpula lacrymans var. lacrymans S7.3]|uniref:Uncharacterized protein n=2 Tax=Serpula lacrymans var. lacrymans TaxID=341189 RepID=F8PIG6_SERL3|nr:uncharacterized protein SERLADRAFT_455348 [Serpula lacrymans var. lacrymans S7.9]EGO05209.1 hypothetical protein SERLA73DRAFT_174215 [Serpula lacrymans var. lacrymans S7.3]EGO30949.1 hypothetical protein SERLADRAFT_455348 [Serpula lacrymans var. lacrymans S7.9]